MSSIELVNLTKKFGDFTAVEDLSLDMPAQSFVALLGPSGCGKTTTMNMISGIQAPDSGTVRFDGQVMNSVPARRRNVGFVFQNYAIFTHLTVYQNLSFGLEIRRVAKPEIERRVREIAALLGLEPVLSEPARRLGVNALQRLAIGRSAITNPQIFLLDEPLSNLDAGFRAVMRTELKHLQRRLGQTMVYVTHDQLEAMSMADRIAIMNHGQLQQYGTPTEVYSQPRNMFVAQFIGSPSMNLLRGRLTATAGGPAQLDLGDAGRITLRGDTVQAQLSRARDAGIVFGIRPEHLAVRPATPNSQALRMTIDVMETIGPRVIFHLSGGEHSVKVVARSGGELRSGMPVEVTVPPDEGRLFDAESGVALGTE